MASQVTVKASVVADTTGFTSSLNRASKSLTSFGSKATRVGRDISTYISLPIVAAATAALKTATAFEFAQKKISALRGGRNIDDLTKSARELGASTIFTATEVSELQLSLAKLGKSNNTIQAIQGTVLQFAQAMDMQLAPAGEFLVKTMNRFADSLQKVGGETEQAAYVGNLFAAVAANTAINAESLASSLNYVGSEAAAYGMSLEDTTTLLGLLADRGFDASRGGTALRRILAQLAKDGYSAEDAIVELLDSTKGFSEELEQFGLRGAGPAAALGGLKDEFIALKLQITQADGFLQGFATTLDTSLQASFKRVASAAQELSISFVDEFADDLRIVTNNLARFIRGLAEMSKSAKSAVVSGGTFTVVFGALATIVGVVVAAIGFLVATFGGIPVAIAAAVIALVSGLTTMAIFRKEVDASKYSVEELRRELQGANKGFEDIAKSKYIDESQLRNLTQYELTLGKLNKQLENQEGKNFFGVLDDQVADLKKQIQDLTKEQSAYAAELRTSILRRQELNKFLGLGDGDNLNQDTGFAGDTLNELLTERKRLLSEIAKEQEDARKGDFLDPEFIKTLKSDLEDVEKVLKLYGKTFDKTGKEKVVDDFADQLSFGAGMGSNPIEFVASLQQGLSDAELNARALFGSLKPILGNEFFAEDGVALEQITKMGELLDERKAQIEEFALAIGEFFGTTIVESLSAVIEGTASAAEVMKENFLRAFNAILAKVIALIVAFTILNILAGGSGKVAKAASSLLKGQDLGSFMLSNSSFDSFGRSSSGGNLRVEGVLSGSDVVLSSRRGATALDRIYG